jgi:hypothetical protein
VFVYFNRYFLRFLGDQTEEKNCEKPIWKMLGTALQFGGVRGDDRFYIPVKARKNQNQRKQAQKTKNGEEEIVDSISDNNNNNQSLYSTTVPSVESVSNIDRFLDSTKLLVPAQYFSKVYLNSSFSCLVLKC